MSDLLSELQSPRTHVQRKCSFAALGDHLEAPEWDQILVILGEIKAQPKLAKKEGKSLAWLGKVLRDHGHYVSDSVIARHHRGSCCCE